MKVWELITRLEAYNPDATVTVIALNGKREFSLSWAGDENAEKHNTPDVYIDVDDLNQHEAG